jgi:hypothetical protein
LGVFFENRPAFVQPAVVLVGQLDGADFGAIPAAGALGRIDVARVFADPGREPAGFAVQGQQFGVGEQFDVEMPADLDQFR